MADKAEKALIAYGVEHGWSKPYIEEIAPTLVKIVRDNS